MFDENDWIDWLAHQSDRSITNQISRTMLTLKPSDEVREQFGAYFQSNLDNILKGQS